jgi:hypothetical protein
MFASASMPLVSQAQSPAGERDPVALNKVERDYVIGQMNLHFTAIQDVLAALAKDDVKRAQDAAASRGSAVVDPTRPATLAAKLPPAWGRMSVATRTGFDDLAKGIASHEKTSESLVRVSKIMEECTGCHKRLRLVEQP